MQIKNLSLKKRLVLSFVGVVILASVLSAAIFTLALVGTMKSSTREKLQETLKVADQRVNDISRGLEIYTDLISSDMTFGQLLSFDSSLAIQQKISEFQQLSHADVVAFLPNPQQYVQIKDQLFVNLGNEGLASDLKASKPILQLLKNAGEKAQKGWIQIQDRLFVFAMKSVLHFGANMGVVFLARTAGDDLSKDIASATGTDIVLLDSKQVFGASLSKGEANEFKLPEMERYGRPTEPQLLVEDYEVLGQSFFSLFSSIEDVEGKPVGRFALLVSTDSIRKAQNSTLRRVFLVATLTALLSALIGFLLARAISNPIQSITRWIQKITEREDLSIRVPDNFKAEIGIMAGAFNRLIARLQDAREKLAASERRMKQELTMASTVQEMLFPTRDVKFRKLELSSFIDASTETGGDWFGYAEDRNQKNVSVMIGDVTGHGMPAALITAIANGFFQGVRETNDALQLATNDSIGSSTKKIGEAAMKMIQSQRLDWPLSTAQMLSILNQILLESTHGSLLMTFFASVFHAENLELRYANAGHNRPFLIKRSEDKGIQISVLPSPPSRRLGENSEVKYEENRVFLEPGDVVTWYTDGLLECENQGGQAYGKRRLLQIMRRIAQSSAKEINEKVIADAYSFFGDVPRKDDVTLVVGKVL